MSCATCIKVDCTETSSLPKYLGGYSLSNGTFAQNAQPITVTTTNQSGPTTITFPPGSIQLSIPTPVPTSPFTFVAVMKQCQASFTIQIPPTQSAAFFDEVIAALAQQLGDCLNSSATPGGGTTHQYVNSPQTISCPGGSQMLLCNPSLYFPQGITFNSSGSGSLSIIGGVVVATTLASANAGAIQLLQSFLTNMINSSNMACGACPTLLLWGLQNITARFGGTTSFIPASGAMQNSFTCQLSISAGSRFGESEVAPFGGNPGGGSASFTYNGPAINCNLHISLTETLDSGVETNCFVSITFPSLGNILHAVFSSNPTGEYDFPFTIPDTGGSPAQLFLFAEGSLAVNTGTTGINSFFNFTGTVTGI